MSIFVPCISYQHLTIESAAAFYDLQEDGSILCEKREDCPEDIPDQVTTGMKIVKMAGE